MQAATRQSAPATSQLKLAPAQDRIVQILVKSAVALRVFILPVPVIPVLPGKVVILTVVILITMVGAMTIRQWIEFISI